MTMLSWFSETSLPRMAAGAISAIYIGDKFDASPMAAPPTMRQATNGEKRLASPVASDDTVNSTADRISSRLRPNRSLNAPATSEPARQPDQRATFCPADVRRRGQMEVLFVKNVRAADDHPIVTEHQPAQRRHKAHRPDEPAVVVRRACPGWGVG